MGFKRDAIRRLSRHVFYSVCRYLSGASVTVLTGVRHINVPSRERLDGCILACNHQSYLDPVLVGMALPRPINYLARSQLFSWPVFSALIRSLGAYPVRQGQADRVALRAVIGLLKRQEPVLLFPEGTRSYDGVLGSFQPGVSLLAFRCNVPVIPVCIEGAFRSWPRSRLLPGPARVCVMYGEPLFPAGKSRDEFMALIHGRIVTMKRELDAMIGR